MIVIVGFKDRDAAQLFRTGKNRRWANLAKIVLRKLDMLDAAVAVDDLRAPPANRLEALRGGRAGQHSIRVNDQFRLCFVWTALGPAEVEIVDYH